MTPSCSIIIRTLNEARYLGELLQAIGNQSYPRRCWEVIIVDSGSSDETLAIANKFKCRVEHISRARFSFGRSLNVGCRVAQGDVLVFISGHCVPTTNEWLWDLVRPFHQPEIAVTYGRQVGGEDSKFSELCLFDKYFPASSDG